MSAFGLILIHELSTLFRTRRVVALLALYLAIGVLGGLGYAKTVQFGQEAAKQAAIDRGLTPDQAEQAIREAADPMRSRLLGAAAGGVEEEEVAKSMSASLVLPIFFWSSLAFLPLLVLLTSFDYISTELAARSLRFSSLRASRAEILLGKAAGHLVVFAGLSGICSLALIGIAGGVLEDTSLLDSLPGLLRVWLLLLPYAACYLAISTFASSTTSKPLFSLLMAVAITIVLRVLGWIGGLIPEESSYAAMRAIRFASPAHYHHGLWLADLSQPLLSSAAYVLFAACFMGLAFLMLKERDL